MGIMRSSKLQRRLKVVENRSKLKLAFTELKGSKYIDCLWGSGTGSILKLVFLMESGFKSEIILYSSWRLKTERYGIISWRGIDVQSHLLEQAFKSLDNQHIEDVLYDEQTNDFQICFENRTQLAVFCDISNDDESEENYTLFGSKEILYVDFAGVVQTEEYEQH